MELSKQVCSLELSKRLRELGVKQESLFYWAEYTYYSDDRELTTDWLLKTKKEADKWVGLTFSAFTVAELGEMLPPSILTKEHGYAFIRMTQRLVTYENNAGYHPYSMIKGDTEADARAKMLIYLIENKIINLQTNE